MNYEKVDSVLNLWAKKNNIYFYSQYKDEEVRSCDIVDLNFNKYQLWIEEPKNKNIKIYIWDYKKRKQKFTTDINSLEKELNKALQNIHEWGNF